MRRKREIRQARRLALAGELAESDLDHDRAENLARLFDEIESRPGFAQEANKNPATAISDAGRGGIRLE